MEHLEENGMLVIRINGVKVIMPYSTRVRTLCQHDHLPAVKESNNWFFSLKYIPLGNNYRAVTEIDARIK